MSVKDTVCIVPARGGSKGIKDKSIQPLGKAPLLSWPIRVAKASLRIGRVIVSTDGEKIAKVGEAENAEVWIRPDELAQDNSTVRDLIFHLIDRFEKEGAVPETIVYLEPTSPFRVTKDIHACLDVLEEGQFDSVATFVKSHVHPTWMFEQNAEDSWKAFQEGHTPWTYGSESSQQAYELNGGVYVFKTASFLREDPVGIYFGKRGFELMPEERSIDIDEPIDLIRADCALDHLGENEFNALKLV